MLEEVVDCALLEVEEDRILGVVAVAVVLLLILGQEVEAEVLRPSFLHIHRSFSLVFALALNEDTVVTPTFFVILADFDHFIDVLLLQCSSHDDEVILHPLETIAQVQGYYLPLLRMDIQDQPQLAS